VALVVASALACATLAAAQPSRQLFIAGTGPDELWDVTTKMEIPGMPMAMPAQTTQVCLKKDRKPDDAIPKQDDCRVTDSKVTGNRLTYRMVCTGKNPMTADGEITSSPTSYEGRMRIRSTKKGEEMDMVQNFRGQRVGACTDQSQRVIAAQKAEGDAMLARTCADGIDKLYAPMFFGQGAACAAQQKAFCDKVGGHARDMREPAGWRTVAAKSNVETLRGAFDACRQDFDATTKAACAKAASTRDWAFVGNGSCDPEVLAAGPVHCKGRDYYTMDRSVVPMCNRYARLERGPSTAGAAGAKGTAPPTQGASGDASKQDPLKSGVDAVRKLLPF
jgi:hypothetical protein